MTKNNLVNLLTFICLAAALAACGQASRPAPSRPPAEPAGSSGPAGSAGSMGSAGSIGSAGSTRSAGSMRSTATSTPASTATLTAVPSATATASPTPTLPPTFTFTPSPEPTSTPTPIPTYVNLRGQVIVEQAVCHYGPGKPYLYKYGVYQGSNLEIIGRDDRGIYVQVRAIGGTNACWVKAEYMKIKGNVMDLKPIPPDEVGLPFSPYYGPLTGVSARRDGDVVTVFWNLLDLRPGDSSEQTPYIVEAWVCQGGQIVFVPAGAYGQAVKIIDEPGCSAPSHGRVTAAEKHGYTRFVEVPWPQPEAGSAPSPTPTP